jgi:hypothetical protein
MQKDFWNIIKFYFWNFISNVTYFQNKIIVQFIVLSLWFFNKNIILSIVDTPINWKKIILQVVFANMNNEIQSIL